MRIIMNSFKDFITTNEDIKPIYQTFYLIKQNIQN